MAFAALMYFIFVMRRDVVWKEEAEYVIEAIKLGLKKRKTITGATWRCIDRSPHRRRWMLYASSS
jgi:hypothetical protein